MKNCYRGKLHVIICAAAIMSMNIDRIIIKSVHAQTVILRPINSETLSEKLIQVSGIITDTFSQYNDAGIDKLTSSIFEDIAQRIIESAGITGSNKIIRNLVVSVSNNMLEGIKKKFGKSITGQLTYDVIMGIIVDSAANAAKDAILNNQNIDKRLAIIGAATSWVAIKQAYNIASSNNAAELVASQGMLLLEVAQENIKAIQEFINAAEAEKKAQIGSRIMDIYTEHMVDIISSNSPYIRMLSMISLEAKLKIERDKLEQPYYGYAYMLSNNILIDILQWERKQEDSVYPFPKDDLEPNPHPSPCGVASCTGDPPKKDTENPPNKETSKDPVTPTIYNFRGFFTGKLSGAESFVGRRMELLGGSLFQTLAAGTNGSLAPVPGVSWQWYSYFDGKKGTNPDYSNNIPITITSASKQEGTVTGAPAVSGQTYNHLYFGEYAGGVTVTGDNYSLPIERGHWIIGSQTDAVNVPRSGSANTTFQGGLDGIATNGEKINGRVNLYMDFGSQNLSGWMHFRRADTSRWGLASFSSVSVSNGRFSGNGTFQSYLNPSNTNGQASIYGSFYGTQAQEIGGGWSIWNTGDSLKGAMGIYRGKEGFANEAAPAAPVQTQPGIQHTGDIAIKFPGSSLSATGFASVASLDGSDMLANGRKAITLNNATVNVTVNNASRLGDDGSAYSYTAWGSWASADYVRKDLTQPQAERGFYVFGRPTLNHEMPLTGTASYSGDVRGVAFDGQTIGGTATFTARFGVPGSILGSTSSIDGSLALRLANNQPWVTLTSTNMSVHFNRFLGGATVQNTGTSTSSGQTSPSAAINGGFYGNTAQEVAGQFYVSGAPGVGGADGVFRAKR